MARVVHFEILADDPERAAALYEAVLAWSIDKPVGMERYWLLSTGSDETPGINGGMMDRHFDQAVINTVQVESLTDVMAKVEVNGGSLAHGPNEIPGIDTHAYFKDTEGNLFGAMQPALT